MVRPHDHCFSDSKIPNCPCSKQPQPKEIQSYCRLSTSAEKQILLICVYSYLCRAAHGTWQKQNKKTFNFNLFFSTPIKHLFIFTKWGWCETET